MWKTVKLGDICDISIGKTPPRGEKRYWDKEKQTDNVWLSIADLTSINGRYASDSKEYVSDEGASLFKPVPGETLVMSFKLSIGKLAFTKRELRTNEAIAALPIKDESVASKEFLYHYLSSMDWNKIAGNDEKVKGKTLNKKKLNALEIILPPLAEQQRIVVKLDAAFAEIERAIEATKRSLLELGVLREEIVATEMLRHANCEDAITKSLADICDLQNGYAFKSKDYIDSSNTLNIRMSNIRPNGDFDADHNARFLPDSYADEYSQFLLNEGDLIIAMTDMAGDPKILGVPTLVTGLQGRNFLLNQRVGRLWKFSADVYVPFLSRFLTTLKSYYKSKGAGGLQINISKKEILSATIHLPPYPEQLKSVERIDGLLALCSRNEHTFIERLDLLSKLKASILAQELQPPQSEAA